MPVCPRCRIAYLDGERHSCARGPYGAALYLPPRWGLTRSLVTFGLLAGASWAVVPWATWGGLQSLRSLPLTLVTGGITGVTMALLLGRLLRGRGPAWTFALGMLALPFAAFVFGALLSSLHFVAGLTTGEPYLGRPATLSPIGAGVGAVAGLLMVWPLSVGLTALAIWTTYQLRSLLEARANMG
jgi:hypothetical protein